MLTDCYYPTSRSRYQDFWFDDTKRWALSVSTAPTEWPVTVAEVRDNARIDIFDDDVWIYNAIKAATELSETFLKRCFCTTTLRLNLDQFPWFEFVLPRPPLVSVTSIKYLDTNGTQQTLSASNYSVDVRSQPGRIVPVYNTDWPIYREFANSIEVIYVAGYGAASAVPNAIKQAIKFAVTEWYNNRETQAQLPEVSKTLLRSEAWGYVP